jgi:hypothetical protein
MTLVPDEMTLVPDEMTLVPDGMALPPDGLPSRDLPQLAVRQPSQRFLLEHKLP